MLTNKPPVVVSICKLYKNALNFMPLAAFMVL